MNQDKLASLKINPAAKRRSRGALYAIGLSVVVITALAVRHTRFWEKEGERVFGGSKRSLTAATTSVTNSTGAAAGESGGTSAQARVSTAGAPPGGPTRS